MGGIDVGNIFGTLILVLFFLLIIFLVLREVACWYWKINQSIALLTEVRDLLAQRLSPVASPVLTTAAPIQAAPSPAKPTSVWEAEVAEAGPGKPAVSSPQKICSSCKSPNHLTARFCENCGAALDSASIR